MVNLAEVFKFEVLEKAEDVSTGESKLRATWLVPNDLPYLEGHFPSQPIVPAVAMIDASVELLRRSFGVGGFRGIKTSKFMNPLVPGLTVEIECKKVGERDWTVDWKTISEAKEHTPSFHLIARLLLLF